MGALYLLPPWTAEPGDAKTCANIDVDFIKVCSTSIPRTLDRRNDGDIASQRSRTINSDSVPALLSPPRPPRLPTRPGLPTPTPKRLPSGAGTSQQSQARPRQALRSEKDRRRICRARQHLVQTARHALVCWRQLFHGTSPLSPTWNAHHLTTIQGRDHTIHAGAPGYVRYYRDPARHPKRKFIGIVFDKEHSLPQPSYAARRRKLGMLAYQMPISATEQLNPGVTHDSPADIGDAQPPVAFTPTVSKSGKADSVNVTLRPGYQYRRANWEIGRSGERKEALAQARGKTTRAYAQFKRGDRFAAWRKSSVRIARNNERRAMKRKGGKKK